MANYTLEVARHSGTFTITANYTKLIPDSDPAVDLYYNSQCNPKTVKTTDQIHTLNISLQYGLYHHHKRSRKGCKSQWVSSEERRNGNY